MANYTNTIPAALKVGDVITITTAGSYAIQRGTFRFEVASAKGGTGGAATAWASLYGYTAGSSVHWGPNTAASGAGGSGGSGMGAVFQRALGDSANALRITLGSVGTTGAAAELAWTAGGSKTGGSGGAGGSSTLTVNGGLVCNVSGGGGGGGGTVSASASSSYPTSAGQIVSRSASSKNGNAGAAGAIVTAPTGYTTVGNSGAGYVKITVLSLNSPPSTPSPIDYGTPLSGRELQLGCGVAKDPDGDAFSYVWEYKTDGSAWVQCAITAANRAAVTVPKTGTNVTFRVKAEDVYGAASGYATGGAKAIVYNFPPVISGEDEERGEIEQPFVYEFTVDDPDLEDVLTVKLYLDSAARLLETIEGAERGKAYSFDLGEIAEGVAMGKHTLIIHAADGQGGEAYRRIAFTRYSSRLELELERPIKTKDLWVTLISMLFFTAGNDYALTVRVKNDPLAEWEDVTALTNAGEIYEFLNSVKSTEGDGEFYCRLCIEKGASQHPIEFRGATFICNANGIEMKYATGVHVNTSLYPAEGTLGPEDSTVQRALNRLSVASSQKGVQILDSYESEAALRAAHPTATAPAMYSVWNGAGEQWDCWVWSDSIRDYRNIGPVSGIQGESGTDGRNAEFGGYYDSVETLAAEHPRGDGKLYLVGEGLGVYYWDEGGAAWALSGSLAAAAGESSADRVSVDTGRFPEGGHLSGADDDVMKALVTLAGLKTGGGGGEDAMLPVVKSSWAGRYVVDAKPPDPALWAVDRVCTVVLDEPENQRALTILANPTEELAPPSAYKARFVFLPAGWEEPPPYDGGQPVMAPIRGVFDVAVARGAPVGAPVYADGEFMVYDGALGYNVVNENYGALTLEDSGWQVGVVIAPGKMMFTANGLDGEIEYGSTPYGYYAKFASGLLLCWQRQIQVPAGGTGTWIYPHAYASSWGMPIVLATVNNTAGATIYVANTTLIGAMVRASEATVFNVLAVGRWD